MEFGTRIKNLRLEQNLTQQGLATAVGVSVVAVRSWERGIKKPAMDTIIALAHELKTTTDGLLGVDLNKSNHISSLLSPSEKKLLSDYRMLDSHGKKAVDMICKLEKERLDASGQMVLSKKKTRERYIPRYATPSAAGFNVPLDGDDFEMILVDESVPYDADYAVSIQGESMSPYIHDGDVVYVKKCDELSSGDIGIFSVEGAMYCKQLYIDAVSGLALVSSNPLLKHTNIYTNEDNCADIKVMGKVLIGQKVDFPDYIFDTDNN